MITDQEIERNQAIINAAISTAAAQKLPTALAAARAAQPYIDQDGRTVVKNAAPRAWLLNEWRERLARWSHIPQMEHVGHDHHRPRVVAALKTLDAALEQLGKRTGDRADAAREELTDERTKLQSALDAFDSVCEDLSGPVAQSLIARITAARAAREQSDRAIHFATRDTIAKARAEADAIEADGRELDREIVRVFNSIQTPALRNWAADLAEARAATIDLEALPGKNPGVRLIHRAIEAGLNAQSHVALLWVVYEKTSDHELLAWRWRAHTEA